MKMKPIFAVGLLVFFCFFSVSCNAQTSAADQRIVGTWIGTVGIATGDDITVTLIFDANGSGSIAVREMNETLTYGISLDGVIVTIGSDAAEDIINNKTLFFSPDGKTLILSVVDMYGTSRDEYRSIYRKR